MQHDFIVGFCFYYVNHIYYNKHNIDGEHNLYELRIEVDNVKRLSSHVVSLVDELSDEKMHEIIRPENYRNPETRADYLNEFLRYYKNFVTWANKNFCADISDRLTRLYPLLQSFIGYMLYNREMDFEAEYSHIPIVKMEEEHKNAIKINRTRMKVYEGLGEEVTHYKPGEDRINYYKPARLSAPLFKMEYPLRRLYDNVLAGYIYPNLNLSDEIRAEAYEAIHRHAQNLKVIISQFNLPINTIYTQMEHILILIATDKYFPYTKNDKEAINKLVMSLCNIDFASINNTTNLSKFTSKLRHNDCLNFSCVLTSIIKIRQLLHDPRHLVDDVHSIKTLDTEELLALTRTGYQIYFDRSSDFLYFSGDGYVTLYNTRTGELFFVDNTHMDYIITSMEIKVNLGLIIYCNEHEGISSILYAFERLFTATDSYENKVLFMKNFETLALMKADTIDSEKVNWKPIVAVLEGMGDLVEPTDAFISLIFGIKLYQKGTYSVYKDILSYMHFLDPYQLIDVSTTHKLLFYSEVDEDKGIEKYLLRTHTPRKVDSNFIESIVYIFRKKLIKSYYIQNSTLMDFIAPESIKREIHTSLVMMATEGHERYDNLDLLLFSEITFKKNFEMNLDNNPILYAKDKASSPLLVKFQGDSASELLDVIESQSYVMSNDMSNLVDNKEDILIQERYPTNEEHEFRFPTKLCMKEKEQKKEGRLFGCATTTHKHELSYINKSIESVLSMLDGQFIAIKNSKKKKQLHENSQLLINPNNYSLMLDIEGHNQSIQPSNMGLLLNEFSSLFGNPIFSSITNYFTNLDVYYNYHFYNKTIYSKGQRGGIEGWMNHAWTLLTLLGCDLLKEFKVLDVQAIMVYSDDVNIIFKQLDMSTENINDIYLDVQSHFRKMGFNVKSSQTIISKNRSTLLRNHYYKGILCEPSLKKILSISSCTENLLVNENIDLQSLTASINSSLEYSNTIFTQTYIKWFKAISISTKPFLHYLFLESKLAEEFKSLTNDKFRILFSTRVTANDFTLVGQEISQNIEYCKAVFKADTVSDLLIKMKETIDANKLFKKNFRHILDAFASDPFVIMLYYIRTVLPEDMGGYNVSTLCTSVLTGISNNKLRTLDEVFFILDHASVNLTPAMRLYFKKLIFSHFMDQTPLDEKKLYNSEFPLADPYITTNSFISNSIKHKVNRKIKNLELLKYLEYNSELDKYREDCINLTRDNFNVRLNMYYEENSVFSIMDTLYNRIESSRSFVKRLRFEPSFFETIYKKNTSSLRHLMGKLTDIDDPRFKSMLKLNIIDILVSMREVNFPNIAFTSINELSYQNLINQTENLGESCFLVRRTRSTIYKDGFITNKAIEVSDGLEAKYLTEDKVKETLSITASKVVKLLYITKWILGNDANVTKSTDLFRVMVENNYIKLCDYNLSYIDTELKFSRFNEKIRLPQGGEIMHRLNNCKFKNRSFIKAIHDKLVNYNVMDDNYEVYRVMYIDSNINYSFCTDLIKLRLAMKEYCEDIRMGYVMFSLSPNQHIINDVRIRFSYKTGVNVKKSEKVPCLKGLDVEKVFMEQEYITSGNISLKRMKVTFRGYESDILNYYKSIKNNYLWINFNLSGDELWKLFRIDFELNYPSFNYLSDFDFRNLVIKVIKDDYNAKRQHLQLLSEEVKEEIYENMIEIYEDEDVNNLTKTYNELINLGYRYFKREGTIHSDIIDEIRLEINRSNKLKEKYLMNLLYRFIIDNCISVFINKYDRLEIDVKVTMDILTSYIINKDCQITNYEYYILFKLLDYEYVESTLRKFSSMISLKLKYINKYMVYEEKPHHNVKVKNIKDISPEFIPDFLVKFSKYKSIRFDSSLIRFFKGSKAMFNEIRINTQTRAHPDSYFSLTGSDTISAGLGIGNYLLEKYDLKKETICDLTAGRGDFHLALQRLGIKHESFSRKDTYTNTFKLPDIRNEITYDILNYETLYFTERFSVIIIDVSFIKGDVKYLGNTIMNMITNDKVIILRINSLNLNILGTFFEENANAIEVQLLHPTNREIRPYQVYVEIKRGKIRQSKFLISDSVKQLFNYYKDSLLINSSNYSIADISNYNSVNSLFDKYELNLNVVNQDYQDAIRSDFISKNLNNAYEYLSTNDMIPITHNQLDLLINKENVLEIKNSVEREEFLFRFISDLPESSKLKILKKYSDNKGVYQLTNINNIKRNKFEIFARLSDFKMLKYKLKSFQIISDNKLIKPEEKFDIETLKRLIEDDTNDDHMIKRNIRYYETIVLLTYAMVTDTYSKVLELLIGLLNKVSNRYMKKRLCMLIKNIKMCSNLEFDINEKLREQDQHFINKIVDSGRLLLDDLYAKTMNTVTRSMLFVHKSREDRDNETRDRQILIDKIKDLTANNNEASTYFMNENFMDDFLASLNGDCNILGDPAPISDKAISDLWSIKDNKPIIPNEEMDGGMNIYENAFVDEGMTQEEMDQMILNDMYDADYDEEEDEYFDEDEDYEE